MSRSIRLPAEWERSDGIMVSYPHSGTDWADMLDEVRACYDELITVAARYGRVLVVCGERSAVSSQLSAISGVECVQVGTNDTWIRDYGFITTRCGDECVLNDFGFNAWGGKFAYELDNGVNGKLYEMGLLNGRYNDCNWFVMEGGSIDTDGQGRLMTTEECLLNANRIRGRSNGVRTRTEVEEVLGRVLGVERVIWLSGVSILGDDTDGHIDTLARFAPNNTILYVSGRLLSEDDQQRAALEGMYEQLIVQAGDCNLYELPMPEPIYDEAGMRLPATYANFLVLNGAVLVPTYGQPRRDALACEVISAAFPGYTIEGINCLPLIKQHGSLHCSTMQMPEGTMEWKRSAVSG